MNIDLIISARDIKEEQIKGKVVVVIDVLRATSVMVTALSRGCEKIIPVKEVEEAIKVASLEENNLKAILGGERNGVKIDGFNFSNSPLDYTCEAVKNKVLVMTTTNGTRAIKNSESAKEIFIASMINGEAIARKLVELNKDVVFINAGTDGMFSIDDFITSGYIISCIKNILVDSNEVNLTDISITAEYLYENNHDVFSIVEKALHYKRLKALGYDEDLKYCFKKSITDIVPVYKNGEIKVLD